ncbi:TetR/AcrR family transcriptional regulator, partial [Streptomyces violaceoruber]
SAIASHMPLLIAGSAHDRLRWSFDVLVNGITRTPVPGPARGAAG